MEKEIFLDVETQRLFDEKSRRDPSLLGISYVGIYERDGAKLHGFFEKDIANLWSILENADNIVGFNIKKFDFPVLSRYYPGDIFKLPVFDLWEEVKNQLGLSLRLDNLARATLGLGKTGSGFDAVRLFEEGKLEELSKYCLHDVKITHDLYEFGKKNKKLKYLDWKNEIQEFNVLWGEKENKSDIQMSLGV